MQKVGLPPGWGRTWLKRKPAWQPTPLMTSFGCLLLGLGSHPPPLFLLAMGWVVCTTLLFINPGVGGQT